MKNTGKKICFAASSGGHMEQLSLLRPLMDEYDSFVVTETTKYKSPLSASRIYYLRQVNRREILFPVWMILNSIKSLGIIIKEKPDVVISTGVLAVIPICLLVKMTRGKLIYIESFAKVNSGTVSGKFLYRFADQFYVQHEEMLKVFPDAIFKGSIY